MEPDDPGGPPKDTNRYIFRRAFGNQRGKHVQLDGFNTSWWCQRSLKVDPSEVSGS